VTVSLVLVCALVGAALGSRLADAVDRAVAARTRMPVGAGAGAVDVGHAARPVSRPVVRLLTGGVLGAIALGTGWCWELPAYLVLGGYLVVLSLVDLATRTLPRRIVYVAGSSGVALLVPAAVLSGEPRRILWAAAGALGSLAGMWLLHGSVRGGLGFGDVRLGAVLGGYLGWQALGLPLAATFLAFVLSAVAGLALLMLGRTGRRGALPFGPYLAAGALTVFLLH
jgi:leader peptidase (prepilin peptidase)/N-methyltransferase